jgi:cytochrome c551/c552
MYDWIRGWIKAVTMKPNGDYDNMEAFMPMTNFSSPIDMELGPDGRIYILEYGKGWFTKNPDAAISRIDFVAGNRPPKINQLIVSKTSGVLPFKLQAKVEAIDPDKDKMNYVWELGNGIKKSTILPSIEHTYTKAGEYAISVLAIDKNLASTNSSPVTISAGNAQPKISIQLKGNQTFYFTGKPVEYAVNVSDEGSTVNKNTIYVANNYTKGTDLAAASMGHQVFTETQAGQALMLKSDCQSCHQVSTKSIGPSYSQVSAKYQNDPNAVTYLAGKIIKGGGGTWGEVAMPAHSAMSDEDAKKIVQWVLSLENKAVNKATLPIQGSLIPAQDNESTIFSIYASYTDQGQAGLKPLTASTTVYLRSNLMNAREITERTRIGFKDSTNTGYMIYPQNNGWFKLSNTDLSGIKNIEFANLSKGSGGVYSIEIRGNSENGVLIGKSSFKDGDIPDQQSTSMVELNLISDKRLNSLYVLIVADPKNLKPRPLLKSITFKE